MIFFSSNVLLESIKLEISLKLLLVTGNESAFIGKRSAERQ